LRIPAVFAPEFAVLIQKLCKQLVSDKKDLQKQLNKAHSKIKTLKEQLERQIMKLRQKQREDDEYANDLREKLDHTERELDQRKIECDGHAGKLIACRCLLLKVGTRSGKNETYPPTSPSPTVQETRSKV
jgi:TolA-binding protein